METPVESPPHRFPVVLDTNAVLDWHVFQDPRAKGLWQALERGLLRWHATPEMLGELAAVMKRPLGLRWEPRRERTLSTQYLPWVELTETPAKVGHGLRCSDPDDQKFLDLALHLPVRWLVTRDRALLKLKRHAAARGLAIVPPEHWTGA